MSANVGDVGRVGDARNGFAYWPKAGPSDRSEAGFQGKSDPPASVQSKGQSGAQGYPSLPSFARRLPAQARPPEASLQPRQGAALDPASGKPLRLLRARGPVSEGRRLRPAPIGKPLGYEAQLIEIDENLMRAELTPAARKDAIKRRKAIYEKLHDKKNGGDRKSDQFAKNANRSADAPRFTAATAAVARRSEMPLRPPAAILRAGAASWSRRRLSLSRQARR